MKNNYKKYIPIWLIFLILFFFALYPESPAKLLTPANGWHSTAPTDAQTNLSAFSEQMRYLRKSEVESPGGVLFRTWSPSKGIQPFELESAPFRPSEYISVVIAGNNKTIQGGIQAYLRCSDSGETKEVFSGSVGVSVVESIVKIPSTWCKSEATLKFTSTEPGILAGIGSAYEISWLSWFKSSFLGKLPYAFLAYIVFALVMLSGASIATRMRYKAIELVPIAFISLGVTSLLAFYIASMLPVEQRWMGILIVQTLVLSGLLLSGKQACTYAFESLLPYFKVWGLVCIIYIAIQCLAVNGLAHWEPNYRFWPARWDADNELPWIFAEAVRNGWNLKDLIGGSWLPTDRPPLMSGAYLLLIDFFKLMQSGNDGLYLRGQAYNFASVVLNTLWVPAVWWGLCNLIPSLGKQRQMVVMIFLSSLPMVLFNSTYGWPKYFGAAFALVATFVVFLDRANDYPSKNYAPFFFLLSALSMLCHASTVFFLAPLSLIFFVRFRSYGFRSLAIGFLLAALLMLSWSLYKYLVLPSSDVLTKYALAGDIGFIHKDRSLFDLVWQRYSELSILEWLKIKGRLSLQSLIPFYQHLNGLDINLDANAGSIAQLRSWDMFMLTKGNLGILLLPAVALFAVGLHKKKNIQPGLRITNPFITMVGLGLSSWFLIIFFFFIPIIIHHWPQAALFSIALGGAVVSGWCCPRLLTLVTLLTFLYTVFVWVVHPLFLSVNIDWWAALVLCIGLITVAILYNRMGPIGLMNSDKMNAKKNEYYVDDQAVKFQKNNKLLSFLFRLYTKLKTSNSQSSSNYLQGIESLRAYAALSVILFDIAAIGQVNIPIPIDFIKSHFGFGVPLFFVVSGFCMTLGYGGKLKNFDAIHNFFLRRFFRIAPLFYFMLIFQLLNLWFTYDTTIPLWKILVNTVFLFNLAPDLVDGIVPASWSIGVEMLFYLIFPVVIFFSTSFWRTLLLLVFAIIISTLFTVFMKPFEGSMPSFIQHSAITNFPYFVWGILSYYAFHFFRARISGHLDRLSSIIICGAAFLFLVLLYKNSELYLFFWARGIRTTWDAFWGLPFGLLCIGLAIYPVKILSNIFTRFMGRLSYSLYLVHPTVIYCLFKLDIYKNIKEAYPNSAWIEFGLCAAITIFIISIISQITYKCIELPGIFLGGEMVKNSENYLLILSVKLKINKYYQLIKNKYLIPEFNSAKQDGKSQILKNSKSNVGIQGELFIFIFAFFLYACIGVFLGSPIFGGDEYAYFIKGKFFVQQNNLIQLDPYLQKVSSPLFLYMLSLFTKLGLEDFTLLLRIIHSFEYCLTGLVLIKLFQGLCSFRYRIAGLLTFLLLPSAYFMFSVMPEIELLLISSLVAYVLVILFPSAPYKASVYSGVLLGISLLIKPHALAIIFTAILFILFLTLLNTKNDRKIILSIKASALMLGAAYIAFLVLWRTCESNWTFNPISALALDFYGRQLGKGITSFAPLDKLIATMKYFAAHLSVIFLIFPPVIIVFGNLLSKMFTGYRFGGEEHDPMIRRADAIILFALLMVLSSVMMASYFVAGAAFINEGEAFRLQGRYLGSALIFMPFLFYYWLDKKRFEIGKSVIFLGIAALSISYFWVFRNFKLFPWDYPLLFSFFSYPNHYGWGFDGGLPAAGNWLLYFLLGGYLVAFFQNKWRGAIISSQLALVLLIGFYQMSSWVYTHTRSNAKLSRDGKAISQLLNAKFGNGVFISEDRYGAMAYTLYGLGSAPKVIVKPSGQLIEYSEVQGFDWVLLGKKYSPKFYYSGELNFDNFNLYLINSRLTVHDREKELLQAGDEILLPLGSGRSGATKLSGFNVQEEWGAATASSNANVLLPFFIKGKVRIKIFGWAPKTLPSKRLKVEIGKSVGYIDLGITPGEGVVTLEVPKQADLMELEIQTIRSIEESRDVGAAIGYIKIEILSR